MVCYNNTDIATKQFVAKQVFEIDQQYPIKTWIDRAGHCKECSEKISECQQIRNIELVKVAHTLFLTVSVIASS